MIGILRELLTPEDQADPYVWAAVLMAHLAIGVGLWVCLAALTRRPLIATGVLYAGFEALQALVAGQLLVWDSLFDWTAVLLGAALASALWQCRPEHARFAAVAAVLIALVGWRRRQ